MERPKATAAAKPPMQEIEDKIYDQVRSGQLKLPMANKITVGQLIEQGNFEIGQDAADVELEGIKHMAIAKIHGQDAKGVYPEHIVSDPDATPAGQINNSLAELGSAHKSLGLIQGEQSKRQYIAELDRAAQQFAEANYPDRHR